MLFAEGGRAFVSADKTSVVSADKTSVVSADKTSVVSQDIPQALWTQGRPLRGRPCVDNEGGMSWETTDVLSADTKALPPSANNKLGLLKTAHLGTIFEAWTLKNASPQGFPKWSPRGLAPHGGHPPPAACPTWGGSPPRRISGNRAWPHMGGVTLPHVGQGFVLAPMGGPNLGPGAHLGPTSFVWPHRTMADLFFVF